MSATLVRIGDVDCSPFTRIALTRLQDARVAEGTARLRLAAERREAIRLLTLDGGSLRAVARLVGVSFQRVQQVVAELRERGELSPPSGGVEVPE